MITFCRPLTSTAHLPHSKYAHCIDYAMAQFDLMNFWKGQPFDGRISDGVRLNMSEGELPDYIGTPCSWHIFSDRAANAIKRRASNTVQFFVAPLYRRGTGERINGYKVLNATRAIQCIDFSKSLVSYREDDPQQLGSVDKWAFNEFVIPRGLHVFRAAEYLPALYFSKQLVEELMSEAPPFKDLAFLEYGGDEVVTIRRETGL